MNDFVNQIKKNFNTICTYEGCTETRWKDCLCPLHWAKVWSHIPDLSVVPPVCRRCSAPITHASLQEQCPMSKGNLDKGGD